MDRLAFDDLLGKRDIPSELTVEDFETDLRNLSDWQATAGNPSRDPTGAKP